MDGTSWRRCENAHCRRCEGMDENTALDCGGHGRVPWFVAHPTNIYNVRDIGTTLRCVMKLDTQ
jgi:hypothetical protein